MNPDSAQRAEAAFGTKSSHRADLGVLAAVGLVIGITVFGHFAKPHNDFYQIRETGRSLISGRLPDSFKRAPLVPLLVAGGGSLLERVLPEDVDESPDLLAAEAINLLLLPANAMLLYLLLFPHAGGAARWAALWFLVLPMGLYCTAHAILEPAVIFFLLLTLIAVRRGSWSAWLFAGLAAVTRYDAAGALLAVGIVELVRGRRLAPTVLRALLAGAPLLVWLGLTAWTWPERSYDHYLSQMAEHPRFDPLWATSAAVQNVFDYREVRLRLPDFLVEHEQTVRVGLVWTIVTFAILGLLSTLRKADPVAIAASTVGVTYLGVHAAFPFQELRFGYPLAPLLLWFGGMGAVAVANRLADRAALRRALRPLAWFLLVLVLLMVWGEIESLHDPFGEGNPWAASLPVLAALGAAVLWGAAHASAGRRATQLALLASVVLLAFVQIRVALPKFGSGREMFQITQSARWVAKYTTADERVLSAEPGILRLYGGMEPAGRYVGFEEIAAEAWPDVLAECRQRGIAFILWHDQQYGEHGGYYAQKLRLDRFDALSEADAAPGVEPIMYFPKSPNVWIFRILPQ